MKAYYTKLNTNVWIRVVKCHMIYSHAIQRKTVCLGAERHLCYAYLGLSYLYVLGCYDNSFFFSSSRGVLETDNELLLFSALLVSDRWKHFQTENEKFLHSHRNVWVCDVWDVARLRLRYWRWRWSWLISDKSEPVQLQPWKVGVFLSPLKKSKEKGGGCAKIHSPTFNWSLLSLSVSFS